MILGKKERRITIAIGLIIGVSSSSMLVRPAIAIKNEPADTRLGSYKSLKCAGSEESFPPLPATITETIPNGVVIFFEANRTSLVQKTDKLINAWVIETAGSFRSERLFLLAEVDVLNSTKTHFIRASELYIKLMKDVTPSSFEQGLDKEKFQVIGKNSLTGELIVQIRNFSPENLHATKKYFNSMPGVKSTRFSSWHSAH